MALEVKLMFLAVAHDDASAIEDDHSAVEVIGETSLDGLLLGK